MITPNSGSRRDTYKRDDPAPDLARVRRSVNPEAYWRERAEVAERERDDAVFIADSMDPFAAELAALRAGVEALADEWDHREYVRMPEDFAASLRALLAQPGRDTPSEAEGSWFREEHEKAKSRNEQIPPHARMIVTNPALSAHTRSEREPWAQHEASTDHETYWNEVRGIHQCHACDWATAPPPAAGQGDERESALTVEVIAHMWRQHGACNWLSTGANVVWSCGIVHPGPIHMQPTTRDRHLAALVMTQIEADRHLAAQPGTDALAEVERQGLGRTLTRLLDEHWPNSGVNPWYLADLLRAAGAEGGEQRG